MKKLPTLLKYFWKHLKKRKVLFFTATILFGLMVLIGDIITPVYVKKLTDVLEQGELTSATQIMFIILGFYIIMRIFLFVSSRFFIKVETFVARDLHQESFEHFTKHSYHFYTNNFTGSLVEKAGRLGNNYTNIFNNLLFTLFSLFITLIGTFVVLFQESVTMGCAFLIFLVIYIILVSWMNKKIVPVYEQRSRARSVFKGITSDIFTNIQTMLFFGNRNYDLKRFEKTNDDTSKIQYKSSKISTNYELSISFLAPMFTVAVTFYAVHLFGLGALTTGSVILVFMLANNVQGQVWRLAGSSRRLAQDVADSVEALEIIEQEPTVLDPAEPEILKINKGEIKFTNISFTYTDGEHVFENFNVHIPHGQSIGVVGKSGSGKTSLTKLLLRLYDPDLGHIEIDGQNIAHITQNDLKSKIAYVPQDTILFHRSIFENIKYGNLNTSDEQVLEAARSAHVDEFVENLEEGYETKVGERGIKLSGGQRQRVGIARAMLKTDAPVLIMDEATSSLDSLSEHYIQESFEQLAKNRTTIVIAHRLSTIQKMDRIIVLDKGCIVEDGSHTELLEKRGYYAELWNSQVDGMIVD